MARNRFASDPLPTGKPGESWGGSLDTHFFSCMANPGNLDTHFFSDLFSHKHKNKLWTSNVLPVEENQGNKANKASVVRISPKCVADSM